MTVVSCELIPGRPPSSDLLAQTFRFKSLPKRISRAAHECQYRNARGQEMDIGSRIRQLREEKGLSQGQIEKITGLPRTYVSRVENSLVLPSLETLERLGAALQVPMHRLFYGPRHRLSNASPTLWTYWRSIARQSAGRRHATVDKNDDLTS